MPPTQSFEDALDDLVEEFANTDRGEIISALELKVMALKEEAEENEED